MLRKMQIEGRNISGQWAEKRGWRNLWPIQSRMAMERETKMKISKCKGCGAPIVWIKTTGGKAMPCDPNWVTYKSEPGGPNRIVTSIGQVLSCKTGVASYEADGVGYVPHWSTCKEADSFRGKR